MIPKFFGVIEEGKLVLDDKDEFAKYIYGIIGRVELVVRKIQNDRTNKQNNSLHLYCYLLATALNNAGLDVRKVLKPEIAIPWTTNGVKNLLWRPVQIARLEKKSTTELTTAEVNIIYNILNLHLSEKFGIHEAFPSKEYADRVEI